MERTLWLPSLTERDRGLALCTKMGSVKVAKLTKTLPLLGQGAKTIANTRRVRCRIAQSTRDLIIIIIIKFRIRIK
jgi:hypothetical protein